MFFPSRRRHTRLVSDSSSDVCSSDLRAGALRPGGAFLFVVFLDGRNQENNEKEGAARTQGASPQSPSPQAGRQAERRGEIGRASCRERVQTSGGAVS